LLEPLKPFEASIQFIINKSTGGRWRYLMRVNATEPDPDDTIDIEATLHRTSNVSFSMTNQFPMFSPFKVGRFRNRLGDFLSSCAAMFPVLLWNPGHVLPGNPARVHCHAH
jgi:hypothetical protein